MSAPLRLLLADDSAGFLDALRAYLAEFAHLEVAATAASGEQAVALAQIHSPHVVLLDVGMPGMGGIEAARILKTLRPAPRVLVLTLDERAWVRQAALDAGADHFIVKDRLHAEFPAWLSRLAAAPDT